MRLLVPFPPGGSTEFTARTLADRLRDAVGQPAVVEHRDGNFGIAALQELIGADADTLMVGGIITNSIVPVLYRQRMDFDYDAEVRPVSRLVEFPSFLLTRTSVPATTVGEFLDHARTRWGRLRNGTDWIGTFVDFDALMLGRAAGLEVVSVARPGGATGLLAALVEGEVDMLFLNTLTGGQGIRAGQVRALAVTGPDRVPEFPGVPTMEESGFAGIGTSNWHGLFASSRMPTETVRLLHRAVTQALQSEACRAAFRKAGARPTPSASPEQFAAEIKAEQARWRALGSELGLPVA